MGNSFPTDKCISVGTNVSIEFECANEEERKKYNVSYYVGGKFLTKRSLLVTYGKDGLIQVLRFTFNEPRSGYTFVIDKAKNNLLNHLHTHDIKQSYETSFIKENKNDWGGVTKTNVAFCGDGNEGNLLVLEEKSKKKVENPCAIKVAHYYALSKESFIGKQKHEVGLSIVVDITVLNNNLDVSWKGYSEHPSLALLQMFQQVYRTRIWKWTACPRSASETQIETEKLLGDMLRQ